MKVHYPKLYNMAHLFTFNAFTDFKGSNNYILFYNTIVKLCIVFMTKSLKRGYVIGQIWYRFIYLKKWYRDSFKA